MNEQITGDRDWVLRIDRRNSAIVHVVGLRQIAGLQIAEQPELIWVKVRSCDEATDRLLRSIPGAARYHLTPDGQLVPDGCLVPVIYLPELEWVSLAERVSFQFPRSPVSATAPVESSSEHWNARVAVRLVRGGEAAIPNWVLTALDIWEDFAVHAPRSRLQSLSFACDRGQRVIVRGEPVPPVRGQMFVERQGIAIPAGWMWTPPVQAFVIHRAMGIPPDDFVLWQADGTLEIILASAFAHGTRSGVRATRRAFANPGSVHERERSEP